MSSDTLATTTPKIPKFHFNQMDQKFIDDVIKNMNGLKESNESKKGWWW